MVHDGTNFLSNTTSSVPQTIRGSFAHKRKHALNLHCIFENLGSPQLFLTITCNDFAPEYQQYDGQQPWDDAVMFATKFKRNFEELFSKYILKNLSKKVEGISDWAWTMEIQQRGSPHIHMLSIIDTVINNYNPYILKLTRSAMDIQINQGNNVRFYLAKYLSKVDSDVELHHNMENTKDHMRGRVVGAIDAAYFLCEKYLNRHPQLDELTITEYFTNYIVIYEQDTEETFDNQGNQAYIGSVDRGGFYRHEQTVFDQQWQMDLPMKCTDKFHCCYQKRSINHQNTCPCRAKKTT
ncbi:hypothetical protein [Parasitella parasitica]|uniref:Helitron helicase-like domain-containing protein n=1 Tax=Parasitella parasitica TaxID=35722 RepID=A0A0B7N1F5_9FUNG|nr:hypothetical protein [Parasitella parasitica]